MRNTHVLLRFPLPHLPLSLAQWLVALGERFRQEYRRCLAVVLTLDTFTRRWGTAIPTQQCGRRDAQFRIQGEDYQHLPAHFLIAGSFQTQKPAGYILLQASVPPWDGLHIVSQHHPSFPQELYIFLDFDGKAHLVDPAMVLSDDLQDTLHRYADRLHID